MIHPASTLYINSTRGKQEEAGVFDDTIRVSIGIEDPDDLIEDFQDGQDLFSAISSFFHTFEISKLLRKCNAQKENRFLI